MLHNNNYRRVNLFFNAATGTGLPEAKFALHGKISTRYTNRTPSRELRRFCAKVAPRRDIGRHSERKCCGILCSLHREAGRHKGEQRDKRGGRASFSSMFFLRNQLVTMRIWGNPEKRRQHGTHKGQRNCTDLLPRRCGYCLLITTAVLWKHRDRSHCRV